MAPYRPPGRSNRANRTQDNDIFEGLPVKQWGQSYSHVSLAPPVQEAAASEDDKWAEPPMPKDSQYLNPYTQQLLRLARSGKVPAKRKADPDADEDKPEDERVEDAKSTLDDRGYVAKKWKPVPEHLMEAEHKRFVYLAPRRNGLPRIYGPEQQTGAPVALRRTKVKKADASGEVAVYEVLVPEGQSIEGEVTESAELAEIKPVIAAPGTVIEGVGVANEEGVMVAEHLKPVIQARRNRPPPKKKGGPGRGKKRVTFTNADGSTYTTVVPNATKIVPQPGQIVKHVAKGEQATADVDASEAPTSAPTQQEGEGGGEVDGEGEGSGSEDGEDDASDDDDDREEGEVSQDEEPATTTQATPKSKEATPEAKPAGSTPPAITKPAPEPADADTTMRSPSSSPDLPLATQAAHSRAASTAGASLATTAEPVPSSTVETDVGSTMPTAAADDDADDADEDLLGNLEKHIQGDQPEA